ncbi:hypothetical protein AVEN_104393-1 [Araneus ventricosus]|uniref:Uncharacterized protein n=1 Tax=Araneus ventricosus TaxID=182803 RepID=A0A4Y2MBA4_ARAVE|nr:hypothetical protein AVEN_104393-1 [Araneus ventricosus]
MSLRSEILVLRPRQFQETKDALKNDTHKGKKRKPRTKSLQKLAANLSLGWWTCHHPWDEQKGQDHCQHVHLVLIWGLLGSPLL